ncbi:MAG: PASTA domain-containing protein [candidate division KSB1 bacterium]|nr:PASTA domain-containing protein [candidate division KSB1 bacterium]MDZ7303507.1 PASTA domain-containing protein [candidate division KSB1 bacterium]MDZ7312691.1 PASTA domain-containing protein [candidate division KSB1 bacterium]
MSQHRLRDFIIAILTNRGVKLIGGIVVLFLILGLIMDWIVMPIYTKHGEAVEVPNVTSLRYEEAKNTLEAQGFTIIRSDERYDEKYPLGYVLEQNPRPYAQVKGGRRIYVVVSRGGRRVTMPQLVDRSQREAELLLARNDLILGRVDSVYSERPRGVVAEQSVPANADVGVGTRVNIAISMGEAPSDATVPSVTGLTFDVAVQLIRQAGLVLGQITYKEVEKLLPETVLGQSLDANVVVRRGTRIDLELSRLPSSANNQP